MSEEIEHKRMVCSLEDLEIKTDGAQKGWFQGYGSHFNNVDKGNDVVDSKAFDRTCVEHKRAGTMPHMLWQHKADQPIGDWLDMTPDSKGLKMTGQLWVGKGIGVAEQAYSLLQSKGRKGLSIGFITKDSKRDVKTNVRTLLDLDLDETSIVTRPMNESAKVITVKTISGKDSITTREAEEILRDAGLSQTEAKAFIASFCKGIEAQRDADAKRAADLADLRRSLTNLTKSFAD